MTDDRAERAEARTRAEKPAALLYERVWAALLRAGTPEGETNDGPR